MQVDKNGMILTASQAVNFIFLNNNLYYLHFYKKCYTMLVKTPQRFSGVLRLFHFIFKSYKTREL